MRRVKHILQSAGTVIVTASLLVNGLPATVRATADEPSLVISQLKITSSNGQFVTLYNTTDAMLDMSQYRLEYFNNYDLANVTSNRQIGLSGSLPPHSYYMVNDDLLTLCHRLTVDSVSLGLSSTAGRLELSVIGQDRSAVLQDYVGWSKKTAADAQTLPSDTSAFLLRRPADAQGNPAIAEPGGGSWQTVRPDPEDTCNLISTDTSDPVMTGLTQLLPASEPLATILSLDDSLNPGPATLPAADIGLKAPLITELLPNPSGSGNDAADEFIELYNPNDTLFDLTGFSLQTGTTSLHTYKFPPGAGLSPHGFKTFYSSETGLSLSNSGSQAKLLDPSGNSISATGTYDTARDGLAWALANGKWYWTTRPTPGAANVISQPPAKKKTAKGQSAKRKTAKSAAKTKSKKSKTTTSAASQTAGDQTPDMPIHVRSLALVGAGAILYGAYEYRDDVKNKIYEFRSYLKTRRAGRA